MKNRIFLLIETKELTPGKFADEIGVERSTMSHIKSDRSKPSLDMAQKVLERYPEVSAEWLILGRGPMLSQKNDSQAFDLFSQVGVNDSQSVEKEQQKPNSTESILTDTYPSNVVTSDTQSSLLQKEESQLSANSSKPERIVERVMIFYSDQTFEELMK